MKIKNFLILGVSAIFLFQTMSCGYFIYPERRGQTGGKIDTSIAILDAIGLLFFLIPGLIAFAVDFSSGTIYLPNTNKNTKKSALDNSYPLLSYETHDQNLSKEEIEEVVFKLTGKKIDLDAPEVKISKLKNLNQAIIEISKANAQLNLVHK
ncbi:MAG: hypothetical protein PWR24_1011 [Desulfonauticus sp.]|nr:hypothetical protein [Desulfonauticus sp.]